MGTLLAIFLSAFGAALDGSGTAWCTLNTVADTREVNVSDVLLQLLAARHLLPSEAVMELAARTTSKCRQLAL